MVRLRGLTRYPLDPWPVLGAVAGLPIGDHIGDHVGGSGVLAARSIPRSTAGGKKQVLAPEHFEQSGRNDRPGKDGNGGGRGLALQQIPEVALRIVKMTERP